MLLLAHLLNIISIYRVIIKARSILIVNNFFISNSIRITNIFPERALNGVLFTTKTFDKIDQKFPTKITNCRPYFEERFSLLYHDHVGASGFVVCYCGA